MSDSSSMQPVRNLGEIYLRCKLLARSHCVDLGVADWTRVSWDNLSCTLWIHVRRLPHWALCCVHNQVENWVAANNHRKSHRVFVLMSLEKPFSLPTFITISMDHSKNIGGGLVRFGALWAPTNCWHVKNSALYYWGMCRQKLFLLTTTKHFWKPSDVPLLMWLTNRLSALARVKTHTMSKMGSIWWAERS